MFCLLLDDFGLVLAFWVREVAAYPPSGDTDATLVVGARLETVGGAFAVVASNSGVEVVLAAVEVSLGESTGSITGSAASGVVGRSSSSSEETVTGLRGATFTREPLDNLRRAPIRGRPGLTATRAP